MTEKAEWDDTRLIKACCRGNASAQKALYDRFSAKMMGVCYRYVRNRADAEDILQEGFIKIFNALDQFESKGSLEGWVRKTMVNTAINFLNKNKRLQHSLTVNDDVHTRTMESADADLYEQDILKMMTQLPEGYRTIINLYAIEGYSHKEISLMLGIAEATSRSQYFRGKEMLLKIQAKQEKIRLPDPKQEENEGR